MSIDKKICFVSLHSYPLLAEKNMGFVGGAEVDQVLLGKALVHWGFSVSFITVSDSQPKEIENIGGIEVIKICQHENFRTLSLLSKVRLVWWALSKVNADIYFQEAGVPYLVSLFCYLKRRKLLYCIAGDMEVMKKFDYSSRFYSKIGINFDIKPADMVVAQSEFQARAVRQNFGKKATVIPPGYPLAELVPEKADPPLVLWVNTIRALKQPEIFLRLAEAIPETRFQMIGGAAMTEPEFYYRVRESAAWIPNLEFQGFIPFYETDQYFRRASILVNTSVTEGFPTTFLQAWAASLPIVSLNVDPDGIIHRNRIGFRSKTFKQLLSDVKLLLKDEKLRMEMGQNARRYAESKHDIKIIAAKYVKMLRANGIK